MPDKFLMPDRVETLPTVLRRTLSISNLDKDLSHTRIEAGTLRKDSRCRKVPWTFIDLVETSFSTFTTVILLGSIGLVMPFAIIRSSQTSLLSNGLPAFRLFPNSRQLRL
jgi:hypothetical protein